MSRVVGVAIAALLLAGCGAPADTREGAPADTREVVPLNYVDLPANACYLSGPYYVLVADASLGVAVKTSEQDASRYPIYWPKGYTAHRVGAEVEVIGTSGTVVAVTGRQYMIPRVPGRESEVIGACIWDFSRQ